MKNFDAKTIIENLNQYISLHEERKKTIDFEFDEFRSGVLFFEWSSGEDDLALELEIVYRTEEDEDGVNHDIDSIKSIKVLHDCTGEDLLEIPVEGLNEHNLRVPIERIFDIKNKVSKHWDDKHFINLLTEGYYQRGNGWIAIGGLK